MRCLCVAVVMAALLVSPSWAAQTTQSDTSQAKSFAAVSNQAPLFNRSAKAPDVNSIPLFANIIKLGGKFYYLGERSNIHGWMVALNDKVQVMYASADGSSVMIGVMLTGEGKSVSSVQVDVAAESEKDIAAIVERVKGVKKDASGAENSDAGYVNNPPLSSGERILRDFQAAPGVVVGHNEAAQINMLVKMNCSACREAWNELKAAVNDGSVQVRLIPVGEALRDDERSAAVLLKSANPAEAWDKYINGDKTALAGEADEAQLNAVRGNFSLANSWKVKITPYMVYRAKDGSVKIVQGKPDKVSAVLSDLVTKSK